MVKLRPELSKTNKYWIERTRYYELKYFCLQYPLWKKAHEQLVTAPISSYELVRTSEGTLRDPVAIAASERELYSRRIILIEKTVRDTDPFLASYLLKAVTEGHAYNYLSTRLEIPCSRDTYYDRYRKFFWLLDRYKTEGGLYL